MKPIIIGLNGGMGVGKSTAIALLKEMVTENDTVLLVKFAQPLYDIQEYIYNRIKSVHTRPSSFIKDRTLLQWLGTDWGRDTISTSLWVDLWLAQVADHTRVATELGCTGKLIIVSDDTRFDNEAETVREAGGTIIRIVSDKAADRIHVLNASHASERGIKPEYVDMLIENNGSVEDFKSSLRHAFYKLGVIDRVGEYLPEIAAQAVNTPQTQSKD